MTRRAIRKSKPDRRRRPRQPGTNGFSIGTHRKLALLSLATLLPTSLIFAPISWWPLSFVCLVPWLILVGGAERAPRVYFYS